MPPNLTGKEYLSSQPELALRWHRYFDRMWTNSVKRGNRAEGKSHCLRWQLPQGSTMDSQSPTISRFPLRVAGASASLLTPQDQQLSNRVQQHLAPDYAPRIHRFFFSLLFSTIIISDALFARMHTCPAAHHFHLHGGLLLRCQELVEPEVPPVSRVARSCGPGGWREGKSSC